MINLCKNYGIAYAQNRGIEKANEIGVDMVLFSDQDTVYPSTFIKNSELVFQRHKNEKIAAVVPIFYNDNKKQMSQISIKKFKTVRKTGNV